MGDRVLFVNVTRQCNVDCDRCYLTLDHRLKKERLSFDTFEKLVSHPWFSEKDLTVIWEGGEAALIGNKAFNGFARLCAEKLPHARQTMVTNLYALPDWLIELSHQYFSSHIETTLALSKKKGLISDEAQFLKAFASSYKKARAAGISCPINIELNRETIRMGPSALLDYLELIGANQIEIDVSVEFKEFFQNPAYGIDGYPLLPLTASYVEFSEYLKSLMTDHWDRVRQLGIHSTLFDQYRLGRSSTMFAVQRGHDFITLNPDGTVTTNPLYSDFPNTYLGDLNNQEPADILFGGKRDRYLRHEMRRTIPCLKCAHFEHCAGGPSHVPVQDGSGECVGMKSIWEQFS